LTTKRPLFSFILLSLLFQFSAACSFSEESPQGEKWVVFTKSQAEDFGIPGWFLSSDQTNDVEYWTPTGKDVLALENGLAPYLQENSKRFYSEGIPVWDRLDDYNRQYIGIIIDGRQSMYANYFCDDGGPDWRTRFVIVMDGGDCFFQFKYDTASGEFFDLQVNGSA